MISEIKQKNKKSVEAAYNAWATINANKIKKIQQENASIEDFIFDPDTKRIAYGTYIINPPLIKKSKLTTVENGGIGKQLSDGWAINYAIGCTHACRFCYVDNIHKRYSQKKFGSIVTMAWGNYFLIPSNLDEAIEKTNWKKWKGIEVMMSSTHDPYLPMLALTTRKILERALPFGVKFCIQTRSPLIEKDFTLLSTYKDQIRLQVSIATMDKDFAKLIEPRVAPPESRLNIIKKAKEYGLETGVIIAPVFPPVKIRPSPSADLEKIISSLAEIRPDHIFGESLHIRGSNLNEIEFAIGEKVMLGNFDNAIEKVFYRLLKKYNLKGKWWKEQH